jgi:hypothetical protein
MPSMSWGAEPDPVAAAKPTHNIACNTLPCSFTRMGLPPLKKGDTEERCFAVSVCARRDALVSGVTAASARPVRGRADAEEGAAAGGRQRLAAADHHYAAYSQTPSGARPIPSFSTTVGTSENSLIVPVVRSRRVRGGLVLTAEDRTQNSDVIQLCDCLC